MCVYLNIQAYIYKMYKQTLLRQWTHPRVAFFAGVDNRNIHAYAPPCYGAAIHESNIMVW
jgi:hypothetical protein